MSYYFEPPTDFEIVSAKAWGVVADGVTDDLTAAQAAVNSLPIGGGLVMFPSGTVQLSAALLIGKGVRLWGMGKHQTVLRGVANTGFNVIQTNSGGGGGQEIAYMQVQANGALNTAVNIRGADHSHIHDCRFFGATDAAVTIDSNNVAGAGVGHVIGDNEIDVTTSVGATGVRFTNSAGVPSTASTACKLTGNHIQADNAVTYGPAGIAHGANTFLGNLFQSRAAGVGTGIAEIAASSADMIIGNYFEAFATGISIPSGSGAGQSPHMVIGNHNDANTAFITNGNTNGGGVVVLGELGQTLIGGSPTARQRQDAYTLANAALGALWTLNNIFVGRVVIISRTDGEMAEFIASNGNATVLVSQSPGNVFSAAAGTPAKTNIYWSAGNNRYEIQNSRGNSQSYDLLIFSTT